MRTKKTLILAVLLVFALLLGACGGSSPAPSTPAPAPAPAPVRDTVVIAIQGEPTSLDPQFAEDGNTRTITDNVIEKLYTLNGQTLEPEPVLATDITQVSVDTWEATLREGVKFHDGDTFDAEDVVYSIKRITDPDFNSQILSYFDAIVDATVLAPNKVQIKTNGFDPLFIKRMTLLPIISKEYTEKTSAEDIVAKANGTGPYKFVSWNRGVDLQITLNEDYWGKKASIKNAKYRIIQEASTRLAALNAGEIDFAVNMLPEYIEDMPKVAMEDGTETYWIRFNQLRGPMVKKEMRLAANYAIDREALAEALFLNAASPAEGQMGKPGFFGYNDSLKSWAYDPDKAKELLDAAGYKGEVIELVSERGRWLKDGEITEAVADMLTQAGFNVQIKFLSWQEWLDTLFNVEKAPALMYSSNGNGFFDVGVMYNTIAHSKGGQAAIGPTYDAKVEAANTEQDPAKRQAMFEELAASFYEDPFGIPLVTLKDIYGMAEDLEWTPRQDSSVTVFEMTYK